jgi:DnaJ-class molecular chaperone
MSDDADDPTPPPDVPCSACRATGRVISNLGGTPHEVPCPWCEGAGKRLPGHNAQASRSGDDEGGGPDLVA